MAFEVHADADGTRLPRMRVRVLVALLLGLALLPVGGGAGASCAAPYLELGGADVTQVVPASHSWWRAERS